MTQTLNQLKIKNWCILLLMALCFGACKKDALKVDTEKTYVQPRTSPATSLEDGGFWLTLKPGGKADILPGGDIVWRATYDISGTKITVKIAETDQKFKFTIISDDELRGPYGEVLKLTQN